MKHHSKTKDVRHSVGVVDNDDENDDDGGPKTRWLSMDALEMNPSGSRTDFDCSAVAHNERDSYALNDHLTPTDRLIIRKLAMRDYHLPGLTYWQDFGQFLNNNHPLLGLFLSHELHPFTVRDRIFCLAGSIAFGLAATSSTILWFYAYGRDLNHVLLHTPFFDVTSGMVALWTFGGAFHSFFDLALWYLTGCPCCHRVKKTTEGGRGAAIFFAFADRWIWVGRHLAACVVLIAAFLALSVVCLRLQVGEDFSFLLSYAIELVTSMFVFYPVGAFVLFSGILGCGRIYRLGGRPYEMRVERKLMSSDDDEDSLAREALAREAKASLTLARSRTLQKQEQRKRREERGGRQNIELVVESGSDSTRSGKKGALGGQAEF